MTHGGICYFGWNGRTECDSESDDLVKDKWYLALDPTTEHADAVYVCPNCLNQPPLDNFIPIMQVSVECIKMIEAECERLRKGA